MISVEGEKMFSLGKLKDQNKHVLYHEVDILNAEDSDDELCATTATHQNKILDEIYEKAHKLNPATTQKRLNLPCLRVYFETDYDLLKELETKILGIPIGDGRDRVNDYVRAMFNQVSAIYANEGITIFISEIFIWESADSYSTNTSTGLDEFVAARPSFNGNLAHLLTFRSKEAQ